LCDTLEHPDLHKRDLSSLEIWSAGGAAVPPSMVAKMSEKLPGTEAGQGYGLTEANGGVARNNGGVYVMKPKSTGTPNPIVEVKIVDLNTGKELPQGSRGELLIKSVLVMKEYWNKPTETQKAIISVNGDPGWFRTGDIAEVDQDGFIYIVDRAKDIIIRGGENVSCGEVEATFYQHPAIMECAAVPISHSRLGEVVGLVVVLKPGYLLNNEDLIKFAKGKLAPFKIPEQQFIYFSTTPLPRSASAKINKLVLKKCLVTKSNL